MTLHPECNPRVEFVCGYRGETDYIVDGEPYTVRYRAANNGYYNGALCWANIRQQVGTVRHSDCTAVRESFPPAEIVALFPGFVGAMYDDATKRYLYDGPAPVVVSDPIWEPDGVVAKAQLDYESDRDRRLRPAQEVGAA